MLEILVKIVMWLLNEIHLGLAGFGRAHDGGGDISPELPRYESPPLASKKSREQRRPNP